MQKALTKMNVQLANVISDIAGVSGRAIIAAILQGERDPLAQELESALQAGRPKESEGASQPGRGGAEPGRELAGRRGVRTAAGGGRLRLMRFQLVCD